MKQFFTILVLCLSLFGFAQEDRTLTEDLTINPNNDLVYNTLDLNGFDVLIKNNASLTVVNLIGPGNVDTQSNGNSSPQPILNVTGFLDCDSVTFNGQQAWNDASNFTACNTLSVPTFTLNLFEIPNGHNYQIVGLTGQIIREGVTDSNTLHELPKNQFFILKVDGYKALKTILE